MRGKRMSAGQPSEAISFWKVWLIPGSLLFLFTLLVYGPSYRGGYIWDDDLMVGNSVVSGGWPGLRDIWTTTRYPDFCPLTATSFWLEWQLGGGTPAVQHATNIFLQGGNVVLVWLVFRRLKISGAWLAALVFAAHPLGVTSVTWIAERKNTLSMFFYLLSLLFYLRSTEPPEPNKEQRNSSSSIQKAKWKKLYWLSFAFFLCAVLSKTSTVVLPVVFLLCAWWRHERISRTAVRSALPFFGVAFAGGVTIVIAHYFFGEKNIPYDHLLVRLLAGAKAFWFYVEHSFWPVKLTMHYPRWEINPASINSYLPALAIAAVFAVGWRFRQGWGKGCLFGLGYFFLALAPTLGFFKMTFLKFSQVADHFQFLALPGLIALVVGGVYYLLQNASRPILYLTHGVFLFVAIPSLVYHSWQHQRILSSAEVLWQDNIAKNPRSWLAHYGMTTILQARGQFREAETHYRQAIAIKPDYLDALNNLGGLLARLDRLPEAMDCYRRALAFDPTVAMIHFNLGTALMSQNKFAEAVVPLARAVELNPKNSNFHNNLASVLMKTGKPDEAFLQVREAIQLNPANDEAQANLGLMLFQSGKTDDAIHQFQSALRLNPANLAAHYRFATLLATLGKSEDALGHLATVVQGQPENILAQTGLAEILKRQGKTQEAAAHQAALGFLRGREFVNQGKFDDAKENFRAALKLDGAGTVTLAGRVSSLSIPNAVAHLDLLASICAEEGQTANAANVLQKIIDLAAAAGQPEVLAKYHRYLEQYRQGLAHP